MSDHIFREVNGELRFIGDFDALYREDADPWLQSQGGYYDLSRAGVGVVITDLCDKWPGVALEVGCGLGHSTNELESLIGGHWTGCDISMEAITRARVNFPSIPFFPVDIAHRRSRARWAKRDVIVWSHIVWYVLEGIDNAMCNSLALLKPGGLLVVSQAVMRGEQRYGREIADGVEGIFALISRTARQHGARLELAACSYDTPVYDDLIMVIRKART